MLKWCSRSIFLQVVLGLALGVVCGLSFPDLSLQLKPLGDGLTKLIKMLIGIIVFCVVVSGISGAGDLKKVGRIGLKSVIYFEVLTTIALVIGLVLAFSTGIGQHFDIATARYHKIVLMSAPYVDGPHTTTLLPTLPFRSIPGPFQPGYVYPPPPPPSRL